MIQELRRFEFTCEHCGRDDQESQWMKIYQKLPNLPNGWDNVKWTDAKETALEYETKMVCPDCLVAVKNGALPEYY